MSQQLSNRNLATKKWIWLKNDLVSKIKSGYYKLGEPLPGENELCRQNDISRTTVRQALKDLENEGLVERFRGKGTFPVDLVDLEIEEKSKNCIECNPYVLIVHEIVRPIFSVLVDGFDDVFSNYHQQILICHSRNNVYKQGDIILKLLSQNISGVAIVPPIEVTPIHQIIQLQNNNIPVVLCHRPIDGVSAPLVCWDSSGIGRIAAEEIIKRGHKKIAYVGLFKYSINKEQFGGFSRVLKSAGISIPEKFVMWGNNPALGESGAGVCEQALAQLLLDNDRPTAIFCSDTVEAEKVYMTALQCGLKVPKDISIVSSDDKHHNSYISSKLALVLKNEFELGTKAAEFLYQMNQKKIAINDNRVIKVALEFAEGKSLISL